MGGETLSVHRTSFIQWISCSFDGNLNCSAMPAEVGERCHPLIKQKRNGMVLGETEFSLLTEPQSYAAVRSSSLRLLFSCYREKMRRSAATVVVVRQVS